MSLHRTAGTQALAFQLDLALKTPRIYMERFLHSTKCPGLSEGEADTTR